MLRTRWLPIAAILTVAFAHGQLFASSCASMGYVAGQKCPSGNQGAPIMLLNACTQIIE